MKNGRGKLSLSFEITDKTTHDHVQIKQKNHQRKNSPVFKQGQSRPGVQGGALADRARARMGGEEVGYQGRKKAKTTNMLFLVDRQGFPLACGSPISGEHHDLYEIEKSMSKIMEALQGANISAAGLFLNADAGFDAEVFRQICGSYGVEPNVAANKRNAGDAEKEGYLFDSKLYKERFAVERTNAWIDGFKGLLVRYETNAKHWMPMHYMAFIAILLRKTEPAS